MSYIQLPYGLVRNEKQLEFNLPKNYEESQYIKRLPYIRPDFNNSVIDIIRNRDDLKNCLLATSDYGQELQEDLNAIVVYDEKIKEATKSYFTHYSCVVIVMFNTTLCRSAFSPVSFRNLCFRLSVLSLNQVFEICVIRLCNFD